MMHISPAARKKAIPATEKVVITAFLQATDDIPNVPRGSYKGGIFKKFVTTLCL